MDQVKKYQSNLVTAVVALGLGLLTKNLMNVNTVSASTLKHAAASFVVVAAAAAGADYVISKEEQQG